MIGGSHSIRRRLLVKLMLPLLALVLVASGSAYAMAYYYSQSVLDQWLYDSAITLAHQLRWVGDRTQVDLSGSALEVFELDVADRIYYEVLSERTGRVFGNATLTAPPRAPLVGAEPVYYDTTVKGAPVRAIALAVISPSNDRVVVNVAETRIKRDRLASQVLIATLVLALLTAVGCATLVWYGIGSGLQTLERAVHEIRLRHNVQPLVPLPAPAQTPSEVRPLIDEINELIDNLRSAYRSQRRFVVDAAHQLRTPLAALHVQLELAARESDGNRSLQNAVRELARIGHLVQQLLALARAEEDKNPLELATVDLAELARGEVERFWDQANAAGSDLGYSGPANGVTIAGIEALLREAVANLIDNAVRYASPGAITVGIDPTAPAVYVEDQGAGIPPAQRERVWDRFYRIPGTRGEGCGLGLAIVAEIARRHQARVEIADGSRGARVTIRFRRESRTGELRTASAD